MITIKFIINTELYVFHFVINLAAVIFPDAIRAYTGARE